MMEETYIVRLMRKYRDAPGMVTQTEYDELRGSGIVNADGYMHDDPDDPGTAIADWEEYIRRNV